MKPVLVLVAALAWSQVPSARPKPAPARVIVLSFVNDIIPILTKSGCANSNCHGSIRGQNGFKLSLFGYEPDLDYAAITKDADGRRIDRTDPEKSLLLAKPAYQIPHGGGEKFKKGSLEYNAILDWVRQGAKFDTPGSPRIASLRVTPEETLLVGLATPRRLTVTATFTDGATQDVSNKVQYTPADETIVSVGGGGEVKPLRPGETTVMIRTLGKAVSARVLVISKPAGKEYTEVPGVNYIDRHVFAKLKRMNVVPARLSNDSEFLRRVYLDTLGVLPTVEETLEFLASADADKRARIIDRLLGRPEYAEVWATRFSDQFRVGLYVGNKASKGIYHWLRAAVEEDRPYNEVVTELLTGAGGFSSNPTANFYRVGIDSKPEQYAINVSQVLLGVRLDCARCHNHPFEKWTQDDFWGFAGFFGRLDYKDGLIDSRLSIKDKSELMHPKTNKPVAAKYLDGPIETEGPDEDIRDKLAAWITSPKNPWFARAIVNRVWKHYLGKGIVEPVDDFRVTNPPSNPALLDALAEDFIGHKYSLRHLSRTILNSRVYQLSAEFNPTNRNDDRNFASYYLKRLLAEQLMDAISQVAGEPETYRGFKPGTRAMSIPAGAPNYLLQAFGRPMMREVICERDDQPAMSQAMHLIAGDTIQKKITAKNGALTRMIDDPYLKDEDVVRRLFFAALVRPPEQAEIDKALAPVREKGKEARRGAFEDLLWVILNSKEFLYNH